MSSLAHVDLRLVDILDGGIERRAGVVGVGGLAQARERGGAVGPLRERAAASPSTSSKLRAAALVRVAITLDKIARGRDLDAPDRSWPRRTA